MSRIGKKPVSLPSGVSLTRDGEFVSVKGPKGTLQTRIDERISVGIENGEVAVTRPDDAPASRSLHGLSRTLIANMLEGVAKGYVRVLEIQGVGYKAEASKSGLRLALGFSHPVDYPAPAGIKLTVENNTIVKVAGPSKELVGQVAAELRSLRPPEPYKGKGVRYQGEQVRRKAGKTGAK